MLKKKLLSMVTATFVSAALLAGCGNSNPQTEPATTSSSAEGTEVSANADTQPPEAEAAAETTEENAADAKATAKEAESTSTETDAEVQEEIQVIGITERNDEMRDITPAELVSEIKAGWNLGNTFDAFGTSGLNAETSWGNPTTTKEMIDTVCEKGFNAIRIPVTYADHMSAAPDYTIEPEWLDRVEEVVNYALDDGMYVIINSHHEEDWRIPDNAHIDAADAQNIALWKQVSERFKDYGDHLIFEGLNEPRVKGGENEWNGGTEEGRRCLDRLNQSFVDTVRATGGNNEKRLVLITSFAASHVLTTINDLAIPEDDHLAVSIHAYTPYAFTYANGESYEVFDWNGSHNSDIVSVMNDLKKTFLDKGISVLITEYGAEEKKDNGEEVNKWAKYYVSKATQKGIPCFWWDNGIYNASGEKFAIFDRKNLTWYREDVVDTIIRESYSNQE